MKTLSRVLLLGILLTTMNGCATYDRALIWVTETAKPEWISTETQNEVDTPTAAEAH